ncbi:MAG: replicative DNA helicase [Bacillota bacterium]
MAKVEALMPQALDAEQALLALCMTIPDAAITAADLLRPADMYTPQHQAAFTAVCSLVAAGKPVDLVTLSDELRKKGDLDTVGGASYLASLLDLPGVDVPTSPGSLEYYAQMIRKAATKRRLMHAGRAIAALASDDGDTEDVMARAEALLADVSRGAEIAEAQLLGSVAEARWREMYRQRHERQPVGIATGFPDLDVILGGLQPADLIVLAARPSMGKTALALQVAYNVAELEMAPVVVFSAEMSAGCLADRLVCMRAGVNSFAARARRLSEDDWEAAVDAAYGLSDIPLYVDDSAELTTTNIRSRARRLKAKHGRLGLIVIDYLGLLQDPVERGESQTVRIGRMTRRCKALAKECGCPVVLLSQLSRAVELRQNKRPQMSDLRDSGEIEQHADVVLFIYRDDYYNQDSDRKGVAEIIVAKQRNGPTGTAELVWDAGKVRFLNLAKGVTL